MIYSIKQLAGDGEVLSGAGEGREVFAALVARTPQPEAPTPAYLDFEGVAVATSSFLRESVVGFRNYARMSSPNLYPVIANPSSAVLEELSFFLKATGDAMWSCDLDEDGHARTPRMIGVLDPASSQTFDIVTRLGNATAPQLVAEHPELEVKQTAWSNRLASLVNKGLLLEYRSGKAKSFSPVLGAV